MVKNTFKNGSVTAAVGEAHLLILCVMLWVHRLKEQKREAHERRRRELIAQVRRIKNINRSSCCERCFTRSGRGNQTDGIYVTFPSAEAGSESQTRPKGSKRRQRRGSAGNSESCAGSRPTRGGRVQGTHRKTWQAIVVEGQRERHAKLAQDVRRRLPSIRDPERRDVLRDCGFHLPRRSSETARTAPRVQAEAGSRGGQARLVHVHLGGQRGKGEERSG